MCAATAQCMFDIDVLTGRVSTIHCAVAAQYASFQSSGTRIDCHNCAATAYKEIMRIIESKMTEVHEGQRLVKTDLVRIIGVRKRGLPFSGNSGSVEQSGRHREIIALKGKKGWSDELFYDQVFRYSKW